MAALFGVMSTGRVYAPVVAVLGGFVVVEVTNSDNALVVNLGHPLTQIYKPTFAIRTASTSLGNDIRLILSDFAECLYGGIMDFGTQPRIPL